MKPCGLPFDARDGVRSARGRKSARRRARLDAEFIAWCHQNAGCVVGRECVAPLAFHHEPPRSHAGEWSDRDGCMLCWRHHDRSVPGSRHDLGLEGFEARWGVDIAAESRRLNCEYENGKETTWRMGKR